MKRRMMVVMFAMALLVFLLPGIVEEVEATNLARDLIVEYDFSGNLTDRLGNSTLRTFGRENDGNNRNNATSGYGRDGNGTYWQWTSTESRGGGFWIDIDRDISENYTVGVRFSFEETGPSWKKIIDYKNSASDNGFYFYDNGKLQFYPHSSLGETRISNNQVVDVVASRSSNGEFSAYLVRGGEAYKELSVNDSRQDAVPAVIDGKTRLGFFFDDIRTSSEATSGGKVYSIRVWDEPIEERQVDVALEEDASRAPTAPTQEPVATAGQEENNLIFDNNNIAGVINGPTTPTRFTIHQPHTITKVETYHWNNQQGAPAGSIGLQHGDGTMYGPWRATARTGYLETQNAYWFVEPNVTIKAGTYTVIDSDPSTWSQNSQSNNEGFARVWGNAEGTAPASPSPDPEPPASGSPEVEATDAGNRMEWPKVSGALGYRIFRSTDANILGDSVTDFFIEELPFIDVNIQPNTDYYYTVKPVLREANPLQDIEEELGEAIATYRVRSSSTMIASSQQRNFIILTIDRPNMIVNGVSEEIDPGRGTVPVITSGRTMVPIRAIVEAMGGSVAWDGSDNRITLNARGNQVEMWLNRNELRVNGRMERMDVAPVSIDGRTFVPLRFSADNLDATAEWINSTREVVIIF